MTLADIIIPLCGSISNERAQKIREACDMQERRVEALEKRVEALSLDVAILVEGTVEAVHEAGLRTLAQRVEALEQIRISHEADYSKSASVLADRIEALDRALSAAAEDNGDLDVRVPALERASAKNTGEGWAEEALSGNGRDQERAQPVRAAPPGAQALDVAGEGREPSRQAAPSPAPSVPFGGVTPEALAHARKVIADHDAVYGSEISDAMRGLPVPAPATGKVPEWVGVLAKLNDAHEIVCKVASDRREWRMSIPVRDTDTDMMLSDAINAAENCIRRLIASRAPRPSPQPSVEEMAERLHKAWIEYHGITDPWSVATDYWLALARTALSAMPAPDEKRVAELESQLAEARKGPPTWACPEHGPTNRCDEDRCCVSCGEDLEEIDTVALWNEKRSKPAPDAPKPACEVYRPTPEVYAYPTESAATTSGHAPKPEREPQGEALSCPHCAKPLPPYSLIREREPQGEPSERIAKFLDALEKRLDVDDDDAWMLSRSDLDYLRACIAHRAPVVAQGEPTLEECVQTYIRAYNKKCSAILHKIDALDSDAQAGLAAVRALCLASRAPSPFWTCVRCNTRHDEALDGPPYVYCHECAVRTPSPSPALLKKSDSAIERMIGHFQCSPFDGSDLIADEARWELAELRKPSPALAAIVEAADAMRTWTDNFLAGVKAKNGLFVSGPGHTQALNKMLRAVEAYDAARHAEGAQPDSACDEIGWLVEITGPKYWTGTPGCGNWTADSLAAMRFARRQDAEAACRHLAPSGAIPVEHAWVSHRPAGAQPSGAPALASAQGEVCECGHGRAMHFDEDGDHNGPCLWQVHKDAPFCKCDMWHRKQSEDEFLGVPVSEWRQIAAEINCRRGPDGSLLKRFRELLEVSDLRAALLKKRSAPSPSPALAALVEAGENLRLYFDHGTLTMRSVPDEENPGERDWVLTHEYVDGARQFLDAWDRARAALPKGGAA